MKKVLFLANHFITLYRFRDELIQRLVSNGYKVYLSLPEAKENKYFADMGCKIIPTDIDRRGVNPLKDIKLICDYRRIISKVNPDIILSYTIKPNIYGACVSGKLGYRQICNITGTGGMFLKKSFVSMIATFLYRYSLKKSYKVFFQNCGDRDLFVKRKMVGGNWDILPGSGVNLQRYKYLPLPETDKLKFIYIGRIMNIKGIDEYLECANRIKHLYPNTVFYIAGWIEEKNYMDTIREYSKEGIVKYLGFRKDIDELIQKCHCTILTSHGGEGVPNVLLESAACGRVCITSRVDGAKDVVDDGKTGYMFEAGNSDELVECVEKFITLDRKKRNEMGLAGRRKVESEFSRDIVTEKYLSEIESCLN